ncbi:MAG: hypothetical protein ACXWYO_07065 [Gaiellaceae bacterium]
MPDHGALYRPVAQHLPAVYQEDESSWEQLTGYLELLDRLYRAYIAQLEDVTTWLSPAAANVQPPGLSAQTQPPVPGGPAAGAAREQALLEELAAWFSFTFPLSWSGGDLEAPQDELRRKERAFVARAARIFRRRGTPQGFVDWFCLAFDVPEAHRPVLIEHFKYRPSGDSSGLTAADPDPYGLRVTLLVPRSAAFDDYRRRREVVEFVRNWLPAHLLTAVCWVDPEAEWRPVDAAGMRSILTRLAGYTPEDDGIHFSGPDIDPIPPNRLGQGRLPGTGVRED